MEIRYNTQQQPPFRLLPLDALDDLHSYFLPNQMVNQTDNNTFQLLKNCEFFRQKFPSPVDLEEFAQLAKSSATHETHNYGTVLLNENDDIDKFYILIEGKVEKIRQKPPHQKNVTLSFDLTPSQEKTKSQHALPTRYCEGSSIRMIRSRPSVRFEETFFFNQKSPKVPSSNSIEKDTSLPMIKPQFDERTLRPSLLLKSFGSPTRVESTTEFETSMFSNSCQISSIEVINETERGSEMNQEDQKLMDFVCKNNFELHKKYFYEGVLGATKVQTYHSGNFLGENSAIQSLQKSSSMLVVSSRQAHFLTFSRESLNTILTILENKAQEKLETFTHVFPSINTTFIKRFSGYFQQRFYQMNETIFYQNDKTQDIYFLCSGEVQLFNEIPIATVISGQFFGEESLINRQARQETAVAKSPNTLVYVLNGGFYDMMKTSLAAFFEILTPLAQEKFSWRKAKASELFEFERNSPKALLACSSSKRTLPSTNCSQITSYFYSGASLETSPISASETSKMSGNTPNHRVTEQFSRAIISCKKGSEPQSFHVRKSPRNILPENLNLTNELSVHSKRKFYNSPSREDFPQKVKVEKDTNRRRGDNHDQEVKSSLQTKKLIQEFGKNSQKYPPNFVPNCEEDMNNPSINSPGKMTKKLQVPGKTAKSNPVKMLIRKF